MHVTTRDRIATLLVAAAALIYGLWLVGFLGEFSAGSVALVVMVLGILASMSAVVPGFAALLRGSRTYLAIASGLGLVAFAAGIATVARATADALAVLVVATLLLWAGATVRHAGVRRHPELAVG